MATLTVPPITERAASVIRIWRGAAEAVQTDRDSARQQAFEYAIAALSADMPTFARLDDLITYYFSGQLQAGAALVSISRQGHVLNYQVIAAAACWQAMERIMQAR